MAAEYLYELEYDKAAEAFAVAAEADDASARLMAGLMRCVRGVFACLKRMNTCRCASYVMASVGFVAYIHVCVSYVYVPFVLLFSVCDIMYRVVVVSINDKCLYINIVLMISVCAYI